MICRSLDTCALRELGDCAVERTITLFKYATYTWSASSADARPDATSWAAASASPGDEQFADALTTLTRARQSGADLEAGRGLAATLRRQHFLRDALRRLPKTPPNGPHQRPHANSSARGRW